MARLRNCQRAPAYNPCMHHASDSPLQTLKSALLDRLTLMLNHVLAAEPQAVQRFKPHAGRVLDATALLPLSLPTAAAGAMPAFDRDDRSADVDAPRVRWRITPAGLLERDEAATVDGPTVVPAADVVLSVEGGIPASAWRAVALGDTSGLRIHGDAALAADVQWIVEHVRWDLAGDLQRLLPAPVAMPAARAAELMLASLQRGAKALDGLWSQRPGAR